MGVARVALDEKYDRLKQLMESGKEKGFVLYDDVNDLLPDDISAGPELDELLVSLDTAGVEILEEPKDLRRPKRARTSRIWSSPRKPAKRPTTRSACTCARWARFRCSRAKARSSWPSGSSAARARSAKRSPARRWSSAKSSAWRGARREDPVSVRDMLLMPDLLVTDEMADRAEAEELLARHRGNRASITGRRSSAGRNCMAISRGMKPKQHRSLR